MKRERICLVYLLAVIFLAACASTDGPVVSNTAQPPAVGNQTASATALVVETSEPGKATVTGRVLSTKTKSPLAETPVRLAEVFRQGEGGYVLDGARSPGSYSNAQGEFVITNVDPKEYVVIVGDPYAANDVGKDDAGKPKPWSLLADQVLDVGTVEVNLP